MKIPHYFVISTIALPNSQCFIVAHQEEHFPGGERDPRGGGGGGAEEEVHGSEGDAQKRLSGSENQFQKKIFRK